MVINSDHEEGGSLGAKEGQCSGLAPCMRSGGIDLFSGSHEDMNGWHRSGVVVL